MEAATKKLERTPLMSFSIHQGRPPRKVGAPPTHIKSIDFTGLAMPGRPTKATQEHFKALIKVKKGIWSEGR